LHEAALSSTTTDVHRSLPFEARDTRHILRAKRDPAQARSKAKIADFSLL
jgi:hypothetical protein